MIDALIEILPEDWIVSTLGEVCRAGGGDIQTGPFGSQLHKSDYVPVGIPSIMPQNIGDNRIIEDGIARIKPSDADRLSRYRVRAGDIVYSRRGDVEKRALIRDPESGWLCGTGCLRVRLGEKGPDPRYASFYLAHPSVREWIVRHAHGATMPNLNTSILGGCPFILPSLEDQTRIVEVLGALDDKIELNRQTNETLEALARALFKDWFVDFGPTRTKAEGGAPYLAPELWALFPDALDDEDKPVGWEVRPLDEIARFLNGLALQKYPASGDEYLPVIKIAELRSGITEKSGKASLDVPPDYVVSDGDVLFSWSGSLVQLVWAGGKGALNQHLFKVTSDEFPKWFHFYWAEQHLPDFRAIAASKATTMGHIQRRHLSESQTIVPDKPVLKAADEMIGPIFRKGIDNDLESRTLAQTRDLLLPKLMSGEIRLRDAERAAEAVL